MGDAVTDDDREQAVLEAMRAKIAESAAELRRLEEDPASPLGGAAEPGAGAPSTPSKWRTRPPARSRPEPAPTPPPAVGAEPAGPAAPGPDLAPVLDRIDEHASHQAARLDAVRSELEAQSGAIEEQHAELQGQARLLAEQRDAVTRQADALREVVDSVADVARQVRGANAQGIAQIEATLRWARLGAIGVLVAILVAVAAIVVAVAL